jgi:hypothetical protein
MAVQFVLATAPPSVYSRATAAHATAILLVAALTWLVMRLVGGVGEAVVTIHPASITDNLQARRIQTQTNVLTTSRRIAAASVDVVRGERRPKAVALHPDRRALRSGKRSRRNGGARLKGT